MFAEREKQKKNLQDELVELRSKAGLLEDKKKEVAALMIKAKEVEKRNARAADSFVEFSYEMDTKKKSKNTTKRPNTSVIVPQVLL